MTVQERFLHYVSFDTQSDENSPTCPSTAKQKVLGAAIVDKSDLRDGRAVRLLQDLMQVK